METGDQRSSGADRVVHVENGVGTGDRNLGYQHGMHGIAKIDEASHGTGSFGIDQNVPVVGIVVDHLGPQGSQPWLYRLFELGDEALDNGPTFRALYEVQPRTGARSMAQIPVKVADGPGCMKPCSARSSSPSAWPKLLISANERLASASGVPANQLTRRTACFSPVAPVTDGR